MGPHTLIVKPEKLDGRQYMRFGARCHMQFGAMIWCVDSHGAERFTPSFTVGDDVYIGDLFRVMCAFGVHIGNGCVISDYVYLNDHNHGMNPWGGHIMRQPLNTKGPISIGAGCFIGLRSIILSGVTLGRNCVVAAGSVVTTSFPDYSVIGGNPARLVKTVTPEDFSCVAQQHAGYAFKGPEVEEEQLSRAASATQR